MPNQPVSSDSSDALEDAVARVATQVAALGGGRHHPPCSATLWQDDLVVTTARPRWRHRQQTLLLPSGEPASATLLGQDLGTDLAVLRLEAPLPQAPAWERADAAGVRAGRFVFAVARGGAGLHSASFGHIAAAGGAWRTWRGGTVDAFIRLDGGLYDGFAGAPLADAAGRLIGIATPNLSRRFGVVIPALTVQRVVDEIATRGHVTRGYLGVALQPVALADRVVAACGLAAAQGLLVSSVAADGPAAAAGLLVGDVVVGVDGQPVAALDALQALIDQRGPGNAVPFDLVRGGARQALTVTLGERPQPQPHTHHAGCRP
jgi:S1-C subfamily serine protease